MRRVYFIKPVGLDGPIKIGCSYSPDGRRRTLSTWSPFALEIVAEIDGGTDIERRFHALHVADHERREWFKGSSAVWATINAIQSGAFDVSTLPEPMNVCHKKANSRAAHLTSWTPERRLLASYNGRVRWAQIKSLTVCPVYVSRVGDPKIRAQIDAYLADPHRHGESLSEYEKRNGCRPWWARNLPRPTEQVSTL